MKKVDLNKKLGLTTKDHSVEPELQSKQKRKYNQSAKKNPLDKLNTLSEQPKPESTEEFDTRLLEEEINRQRKEKNEQEQKERLSKILQITLIVGCIYLVFLIFGVINTQYVYDDTGAVVAQRMSVAQIRDLDNYNKYIAQYSQARFLYEQVLVMDYRVGAGEEDILAIAPDYENLLESINDLAIQISALELPAEYTQNLEMLTSWVQTDIAVYCQSMSKAISQNNTESANLALEYRNRMYANFAVITQNTIMIGNNVAGADVSDICTWSPESYIQNRIGGIITSE